MSEQPIKILLVEDNLEYGQRLRQEFENAAPGSFAITQVGFLQSALQYISLETCDLILLDLVLPDSQGYNTFTEIYNQSPDLPMVVITTLDDPALAQRIVREGAQDYLVKKDINCNQLIRSVRFALERHHTKEQLRQLSLVDELTGLLNRRGFFSLGIQHINIAKRANRQMLLFYIDLDGLKNINDQYGHHEGDRALRKIAAILKETFRSSDLIARMGGDEFTVLAIDAVHESAESMLSRLESALRTANLKNPVYQLSLSTGFARFDPKDAPSLENMLIEADQALYQYRQNKNIS